MKVNEELRGTMRRAIVEYLTEVGSAMRSELVDGATARLGLSARQLQNQSATGTYQTLRSYVGGMIDDMEAEGTLCRADRRYTLAKEGLVIVKEDQCEAQIRVMLAKGTFTKNEIFKELDRYFGANQTVSRRDDAMLHSIAGSVLGKLVKQGAVTVTGEGYALPAGQQKVQIRPMGAEAFKKEFLARLYRLGGPFFERYLCNLLEKYYTVTGRKVLVCEVTGGSADGGVDVVVDTVDGLGFVEHVMVQAKCRERSHVTEKEVREFYGALTALSGSRGIYATTTVFHSGAQRFLDSLDNCVGIDGDKLFALAEMTAYGIMKGKNGYRFDEAIFK